MTEQNLLQPAVAPAVTKEPETLEEIKAVMEAHGDEPVPIPQKPQAHAAPEAAPEAPKPIAAAKPEEKKNQELTGPGDLEKALAQARYEAREEKRKLTLLEGTLAEIKAIKSPQQAQVEDKEPDRKIDPDGWFEWKLRAQDKKLQEIEQFRTQTAQQSEQQQAVQRLVSSVAAQEVEYAEKNQDYYDSLRFLEKQRTEYHKGQGIEDQAQINQLVLRDKLQAANNAMGMGINSALWFHNLARSMGFQPVATPSNPAAPAAPAPGTPAPVQSQAAPVQVPTVASDPALAAAQKGQAAATSLSKAGGGTPTVSDEVTMESLGKLKGRDFDRAMNKFRQQNGLGAR